MDEEEIKNWLDVIGRDRQWLADQCGVSKATVNGWLSAGRNIPAPAAKLIARLMNGPDEINPELPLRDVLAAQRAAQRAGLTLDEWIAELIKAEVCRGAKSSLPLVAEPNAPYGGKGQTGSAPALDPVESETRPPFAPGSASPGDSSPSASSSDVA